MVYNYFRYYDPSTGRYITSDPVGLIGGLNTYGYVGGNPLYWIDRYGLESVVAGAPGTVAVPRPKPISFPLWVRNPAGIAIWSAVTPNPIAPSTCIGGLGTCGPYFNQDANDTDDPKQCEDEKSRQKGDRFKEGDNAQDQFEEIEKAQRKYRQGKSKQIIDSIEKSRQRDKNALRPENWDDWRDHLDD